MMTAISSLFMACCSRLVRRRRHLYYEPLRGVHRPVTPVPIIEDESSMSEVSAARSAPVRMSVVLLGLLRSLRVKQWAKNSVIFAALIFARQFDDFERVLRSSLAFGVFCLLSSSVYLLNDVFDLAKDRAHPTKCRRPVAAGEVPPPVAVVAGLAIGGGSLVLAYMLVPSFAVVGAVYLVSNLLYSVWLKKIVIVDVMVISMGFVLRAVAGGLAIEVDVSAWLIICTILLSLFLALCKRRQEMALLANAAHYRDILKEYSVEFVDQMITIVTAATLVAYCSYTLSTDVQHRLGTENLYVTVPFVIYGIFRYLYLVHKKEKGGSPTEALFSDPPLMLNILLWATASVLLLYLS
jgi:4-hydroxybenzoate polyprenyltransferase